MRRRCSNLQHCRLWPLPADASLRHRPSETQGPGSRPSGPSSCPPSTAPLLSTSGPTLRISPRGSSATSAQRRAQLPAVSSPFRSCR